LISHQIKSGGFDFTCAIVQTVEQFRTEIRARHPDIVLADYNLGQWTGMDALEILCQENLDIPLILVTGALGEVKAVDCIKHGAADFVLKAGLSRLPLAIRRTLEEKRLREQRRHAEEELAAKVKELARSNRDLEQFAFVASHDLQEPLRMVASYTQLLAERYRGKLDENADKYIGYAVEGALRMQALIRDMLAFSRVGRTGNPRGGGDCDTAVKAALLNLAAVVAETKATVIYESLPPVAVELTQLIQLFQNLIGNAIKFRGKDPPTIRISAEQHDLRWQFAVADNGIGIASEHQDVIFVIFQRLHARGDYEGNGLGLAICQKIVEQSGGKIWIDSEPGQGSTFRFTLPKLIPKKESE
jgi:light-regulated signal transduction histidine kinase (bacteriophytochrome)